MGSKTGDARTVMKQRVEYIELDEYARVIWVWRRNGPEPRRYAGVTRASMVRAEKLRPQAMGAHQTPNGIMMRFGETPPHD